MRDPEQLLAELRLLGADPRVRFLPSGHIELCWGNLTRTRDMLITAAETAALKTWLVAEARAIAARQEAGAGAPAPSILAVVARCEEAVEKRATERSKRRA